MEWLYHLSPGILTAILAVLAAVTALPIVTEAIKDKWWVHAVAVLVFVLIASAEIVVIRHADQESEQRIKFLQEQIVLTVNNTTFIQRRLDGYIKSQEIVTKAQRDKQQRHKGMDELFDLKIRTAQLAANIFSLLLDRSQMAPPIPNPATWEQDIQKAAPFDRQTVILYEQKYGAQAKAITEELARHGVKDERLEMWVVAPTNTMGVTAVAEHLAAQAERITPQGIKPLNRFLVP